MSWTNAEIDMLLGRFDRIAASLESEPKVNILYGIEPGQRLTFLFAGVAGEFTVTFKGWLDEAHNFALSEAIPDHPIVISVAHVAFVIKLPNKTDLPKKADEEA